VIVDCRVWKDRRWQQTAAVTAEEVAGECDLFWWDGNCLHVAFYPVGREAQVVAGRAGGYKGGRPKNNPSENPSENPPAGKGKAPQKPEEKIREGKKGKEEREEAHSHTSDVLVSKLKSLRQSWVKPAILTNREKVLFESNRDIFESYDDTDWTIQREYLAARLPQGDPSWQPLTLIQLLEHPTDVYAHAFRWKAKQRPALAVVKAPPASNEPAATKAEIAAMFQALKQA
jgi:hypothetical protein